jgi:hypothetical protein
MNKITKRVLCLTGVITMGLLYLNGEQLIASQNLEQGYEISPIFIYDEEELLEISLEDVGKYHGDICPCVVIGFRVTQFAISQLWKPARPLEEEAGGDEIPKRKDFRIISKFPGQGSQDAFEFITRAKTRDDFILELPEGTDAANISLDNCVFIIIRKSTGKQIKIWLKEEVFPEGSEKFFNLRKKAKFDETATQKEKEKFRSAKQELKQRFMDWQTDNLFGFERRF